MKWVIWVAYMTGVFSVVTWLLALEAPIYAWVGLFTLMLGSGALNAIGYPFGPELMRKSRQELMDTPPPANKERSYLAR